MKGWIWVESLLRARARRPAYPAAKPCSRRGGGAWRLYQARSAERLEPWCLCVEAGGSTTTTTTTIIAVFEMDAGSVAARASSRPGRHSECFDGCTEPRSPAAPRRIWRLGVEFSLSRMAALGGSVAGLQHMESRVADQAKRWCLFASRGLFGCCSLPAATALGRLEFAL